MIINHEKVKSLKLSVVSNFNDYFSKNSIEDINGEYILFLENQKIEEIELEKIEESILEYKRRALDVVFFKAGKETAGYLFENKETLFKDSGKLIVAIHKKYIEAYKKNCSNIKNRIIIDKVFNDEAIYIDEGKIKKIEEQEDNFQLFYSALNEFLETKESIDEDLTLIVEEAFRYLLKKYISKDNNCNKSNFEKLKLLVKNLKKVNGNIQFNKLADIINLMEENNFEMTNCHLWYKLNKRNMYNIKIFETENHTDKIIFSCAWLCFMHSKKDKEIIRDIEFYLLEKDSNRKIYLDKGSSERSFYKFDYPHEKYVNEEDNFRLIIDKNKLSSGRYTLGFDFLGEKGKFTLANFATTRKLNNEIFSQKNKIISISYDVNSRDFSITIKEREKNLFEKIKLKKFLIKEDLENLKRAKIKNYNLKQMYFTYEFKKKSYGKPILLIGEMHDTYEDSGSVLFEELLKDNRGYEVFFVTSRKDLLQRNKRFIEFGSKKHKDLFLLADVLINVQNIDLYMSPFIGRNSNLSPKKHSKDSLLYLGFSKYLKNQKKIFLQHGVLYQSGLTNGIYVNADFDYLVVSADFEKKIFPEGYRTFIESGLPRFSNYDKEGYKTKSKKILFSPTWRKYLKDMSNGELKLDEIVNSEYYIRIMSFLNNEKLAEILKENNYELIYNVHHTLRELIELDIGKKQLSENIKIKDENVSLNSLIKECDMCITDYSSLFFDFLWQGKPVINYIYDYEDFHTRKDNNKKLNDYFSLVDENNNCVFYEKDIIGNMEKIIKNKGKINKKIRLYDNSNSLDEFLMLLKKII